MAPPGQSTAARRVTIVGRYELTASLWLPRPRAEVFAFFGDAQNLDAITPPWLHFRILTAAPIHMRPGTRIDYRLRLRGLPVRWRTEIARWEPPAVFVDRQVRGPYRVWVHTHTFTDDGRGTRVEDRVVYDFAGGVLLHRWLVGPDLRRIFAYRAEALRRHFGVETTGAPDVRVGPLARK